MKRGLRVLAAAGSLLLASSADAAFAQKQGGILKIGHFDSPASMSMHEESTAAVNRPMMGVFNNLVVYDQHVLQNSPQSIVPELATGWAWNEEGTELTLPLHQGIKWHTASRSPPRMSNARSTCCREQEVRSCASTRAKPGTATSKK